MGSNAPVVGALGLRALELRCWDIILWWESALRLCFLTIPQYVFHRFRSTEKVVSFFFVYVMLQALALLWAFLGNVATVLGENMMSIVLMPIQQAACVLLMHSAVILMILAFGRAMWILTWQSTDNFPLIRRMMAEQCRPQTVIITTAIPLLVILPCLMFVPYLCEEEHPSFQMITVAVRHAVCEESYLKFISHKFPVFQRALRLSTAIALVQFVQACLETLPGWRKALSGLSRRSVLLLGGTLAFLNGFGALWWIEWLARHVSYHATPLSSLSVPEWELFGLSLLFVWILWYIAMTCHTFRNVKESEVTSEGLIGLFERLKYTFVFGQAIIFFRACLHPQLGFVHAQLELTVINILLPSIYVFSLMTLRLVTMSDWKSVSLSLPFALIVGTLVFRGSGMEHKPHSFIVLTVFLFILGLRLSEAFFSFRELNGFNLALTIMLRSSTPSGKNVTRGHRMAKKVVVVAGVISVLLIAAISGFSILSVVQQNTGWYPDATSVHYHSPTSISVHHTSAVKLHLDLANDSHPFIHKEKPEYASCTHLWNGLNLVDYALFAQAAYFDPLSQDIPRFIATMYNSTFEKTIEIRHPPLNTKTGGKSDFYEAVIPSLNISVIAVRGTDIWRFTDFIEDIKMFIEPVNFAVLSTIFPTIRIWPDITFSTLIELYHEMIALLGLQHEYWYYQELIEYVQAIEDRDVVLTGHSLGGGIARVVGSILGKTSVTFSPPGFVQGYSKMVHEIGGKTRKVNRQKLHHMNVAVIPEYDPITMVDAQAGLIQKISCNTAHLSMQLSCHMLEGSICNLLEHCGDDRKRIAACQFEHQIAGIADDILPLIASFGLSYDAVVPLLVLAAVLMSVLIRSHRSLTPNTAPAPSEADPVLPRKRVRHRRRSPSSRRKTVG